MYGAECRRPVLGAARARSRGLETEAAARWWRGSSWWGPGFWPKTRASLRFLRMRSERSSRWRKLVVGGSDGWGLRGNWGFGVVGTGGLGAGEGLRVTGWEWECGKMCSSESGMVTGMMGDEKTA